jgi:hypothetical protein
MHLVLSFPFNSSGLAHYHIEALDHHHRELLKRDTDEYIIPSSSIFLTSSASARRQTTVTCGLLKRDEDKGVTGQR